jgi:hypothetical protein
MGCKEKTEVICGGGMKRKGECEIFILLAAAASVLSHSQLQVFEVRAPTAAT